MTRATISIARVAVIKNRSALAEKGMLCASDQYSKNKGSAEPNTVFQK
jgi:hypothetical protein